MKGEAKPSYSSSRRKPGPSVLRLNVLKSLGPGFRRGDDEN
jgi:hypothetical protein